MLDAPVPADEADRLAALYRMRILDTEPEERFDRISRLAAALTRVPISMVTLIDRDRQWFKAACGLDIRSTPRNVAFAAHAITETTPLIVVDAKNDPRFADNPFVVGEPGIRFYAGFPIESIEGHKIGTLCLIDRKPRRLTEEECRHLHDLARIAEDQLRLSDAAGLYAEMLKSKKALEAVNQTLARRNQRVRNVFRSYMAEEVVETVLESSEALKLGGDVRKIAVLAVDLRDFTSLVERLSPAGVVPTLNAFLGRMIDIIDRHGGTIDQIQGDGILAIFGAMKTRHDDADRAVRCAIEIQRALHERREDAPEPLAGGRLRAGVGVCAGEAVVGNIGSEKRKKFSVIGSVVNLAARLQSLSDGGEVLACESLCRELEGRMRFRHRGNVAIRGFSEPVPVYSVVGARPLTRTPQSRDEERLDRAKDLLPLPTVRSTDVR